MIVEEQNAEPFSALNKDTEHLLNTVLSLIAITELGRGDQMLLHCLFRFKINYIKLILNLIQSYQIHSHLLIFYILN